MLAAGYAGPLSLEVFNDVFRQADPARAAVDAHALAAVAARRRSRCAARRGAAAPPAAPALTGYAFTELAVDGVSGPEVAGALAALGFTHTGQHRSKPVQLWEQGEARVLLNASVVRPSGAGVAAVGRARRWRAPTRPVGARGPRRCSRPCCPAPAAPPRPTWPPSPPPTAPQVFFARTGPDGWPADFLPTGARRRRRAPGSPPSTTSR